jgi:hypothetical protein
VLGLKFLLWSSNRHFIVLNDSYYKIRPWDSISFCVMCEFTMTNFRRYLNRTCVCWGRIRMSIRLICRLFQFLLTNSKILSFTSYTINRLPITVILPTAHSDIQTTNKQYILYFWIFRYLVYSWSYLKNKVQTALFKDPFRSAK